MAVFLVVVFGRRIFGGIVDVVGLVGRLDGVTVVEHRIMAGFEAGGSAGVMGGSPGSGPTGVLMHRLLVHGLVGDGLFVNRFFVSGLVKDLLFMDGLFVTGFCRLGLFLQVLFLHGLALHGLVMDRRVLRGVLVPGCLADGLGV
jgi:hypothetical protein